MLLLLILELQPWSLVRLEVDPVHCYESLDQSVIELPSRLSVPLDEKGKEQEQKPEVAAFCTSGWREALNS